MKARQRGVQVNQIRKYIVLIKLRHVEIKMARRRPQRERRKVLGEGLPWWTALEVFLVILELSLRFGVGVSTTGLVESLGDYRRAAEENSDSAALVLLRLLGVDGINIRTSVVGARLETSKSVTTISIDLLIASRSLTSEEEVDGEEIAVTFEVLKEIQEPFEGRAVTVGPVELDSLDLGGFGLNLELERLKDGSEGSNTNTSGPEMQVFEFDDVLRSGSEGTVDEQDRFSVGSVHHVLLNDSELLIRIHKIV